MRASPQGRNLIRSLPLPRFPWYVQTKSEGSLGESFATREKTSLLLVTATFPLLGLEKPKGVLVKTSPQERNLRWPGATRYGQVRSGTARYGQVWSGTARRGQVRSGTARYGAQVTVTEVRPGTAMYGQVRPGTARYGQVWPGTARYGQVRPGTARYGQVRSGMAKYGEVPMGALMEASPQARKLLCSLPPPLFPW